MITTHIGLRRVTGLPPTDAEAYRGMANICWAYEELIGKKIDQCDPTHYERIEDIPVDQIRKIIEVAFHHMREAALQFDLDVSWPPRHRDAKKGLNEFGDKK